MNIRASLYKYKTYRLHEYQKKIFTALGLQYKWILTKNIINKIKKKLHEFKIIVILKRCWEKGKVRCRQLIILIEMKPKFNLIKNNRTLFKPIVFRWFEFPL